MLEQIRAWLARMIAPQGADPQPLTGKDLLEAFGGTPTWSGASVNEQSAMSISAVYACVSLIGGAIASLPLNVYVRDGDSRKRVGRDQSNSLGELWYLLNQRPSPSMSAAVMWEYALWSLLLHGDSFLRIARRGKSPTAFGFMPWHPNRVRVESNGGDLVYYLLNDAGADERVDAGDMLHIPGVGFDGKRGMSVVQYAAKQALGIALSAEEYSAKFFGNGAKPDFALMTDGDLSEEAVITLRNTWQTRYGGVINSHLPAVLTGGLKMQELTMNAKDAALLETRVFQVIDIARMFGVPPHMIGETEKATSWGSGVENMGIGFVKYTLQRHLTKIEQELNDKLFGRRGTAFVEFGVEGLLRGDSKTRSDFYKSALGGSGVPGWMTPNEVRRLENLPPIDGGDDLVRGGQEPAPDFDRGGPDE